MSDPLEVVAPETAGKTSQGARESEDEDEPEQEQESSDEATAARPIRKVGKRRGGRALSAKTTLKQQVALLDELSRYQHPEDKHIMGAAKKRMSLLLMIPFSVPALSSLDYESNGIFAVVATARGSDKRPPAADVAIIGDSAYVPITELRILRGARSRNEQWWSFDNENVTSDDSLRAMLVLTVPETDPSKNADKDPRIRQLITPKTLGGVMDRVQTENTRDGGNLAVLYARANFLFPADPSVCGFTVMKHRRYYCVPEDGETVGASPHDYKRSEFPAMSHKLLRTREE